MFFKVFSIDNASIEEILANKNVAYQQLRKKNLEDLQIMKSSAEFCARNARWESLDWGRFGPGTLTWSERNEQNQKREWAWMIGNVILEKEGQRKQMYKRGRK